MRLFAALVFAAALAAQSVVPNPVAAPSFAGSGLNDMASGGQFLGTQNVTYTIAVDSTGATDTFSWTATDGGSGIAVSMTGGTCAALPGGTGWQALSHGVLVCWLAKTGHTLADAWAVAVNVNGTVAAQTVVYPAVGARARNAQSKLADLMNGRDFGMHCDGTYDPGAGYAGTDDTAAFQSAILWARTTGNVLVLPTGKCLVGNVSISLTGTQALTMSGAAPCYVAVAVGGTSNPPVCASQIICTKADGSACMSDAASTGAGDPVYHFRDFSVLGLDSYYGGTVSGTGIRITNGGGGGTATVDFDDLYFYGFDASGAVGFEINRAENNHINHVRTSNSGGCAWFGGTSAADTDIGQTYVSDLICDQSTGNAGVEIVAGGEFFWKGGLVQSNNGDGVYVLDGIGNFLGGIYFENNNRNCTNPNGQECTNGMGAVHITSISPYTTQHVTLGENNYVGGHEKLIVDGYNTVSVDLGQAYNNAVANPGVYLGSATRNVKIDGLYQDPLPGTVGETYFVGTGLNDSNAGGVYTGTDYTRYEVLITAGAPDSFTWQNITTGGPISGPIDMNGTCQAIELGLCVGFTATTGHTTGNYAVLIGSPYPFWQIEDHGTDNSVSFGNWTTALNSGVARNFVGNTNTYGAVNAVGGFKVNGTPVVDSGRNGSFAGLSASGAFSTGGCGSHNICQSDVQNDNMIESIDSTTGGAVALQMNDASSFLAGLGNYPMRIGTNSVFPIWISTTGPIGIGSGCSSPAYQLDVCGGGGTGHYSGALTVDGTLTVGGALVTGYTGTQIVTTCTTYTGGVPTGCSAVTNTYVNGLLQ